MNNIQVNKIKFYTFCKLITFFLLVFCGFTNMVVHALPVLQQNQRLLVEVQRVFDELEEIRVYIRQNVELLTLQRRQWGINMENRLFILILEGRMRLAYIGDRLQQIRIGPPETTPENRGLLRDRLFDFNLIMHRELVRWRYVREHIVDLLVEQQREMLGEVEARALTTNEQEVERNLLFLRERQDRENADRLPTFTTSNSGWTVTAGYW
jgi:hypothetical protein